MRNIWLALLIGGSTSALAAPSQVDVPQGGIGRWAGGDATRCTFENRILLISTES